MWATGEKASKPDSMNPSDDKSSESDSSANDGSKRKTRSNAFEYVEPIGARVVVRKDEAKRETRGGIALPDQAEIPTITGRIVTISALIESDIDVPLRQYDKVLYHPKDAIPVDFEPDNQLFVVPVDDIVAVFRREPPSRESE